MYKITLILVGVTPLGVHDQNTLGENGDFQPVYATISRKR